MKFCPSCGAQCAIEDRFCHVCGKEVRPAQPNESAPAPVVVNDASVDAARFSTALTYGNQVTLAFVWLLLCSLKGYDRKAWFDGSTEALLVVLAICAALAGVIYLLVVHMGIRKRQPGVVLGTAIAYTVLNLLAWLGSVDEFALYNFYDWMGEVITLIQIGLMFMIYAEIKPKVGH